MFLNPTSSFCKWLHQLKLSPAVQRVLFAPILAIIAIIFFPNFFQSDEWYIKLHFAGDC